MKLSSNIARVQQSGTMAYFARVKELVRTGQDIISLATGELDTPTPRHAAQAGVQAILDGRTRYTLNNGTLPLREAIAERYTAQCGILCSAERVLVSNGSKQALFNVLYSLCGTGDEVIVLAPYYPSYPDQIVMVGGQPVLVATGADQHYQPDPETIAAAITDRTRVIILNSPNNPTGTVYDRERLKAIAELARKHDLWVVSDDIYEDIVYPPHEHISAAAVAPDLTDRIITISGLSKSFAMTGWRVGYAIGPREVIAAAGLVQSHTTNNACSISQEAALAALTVPSDWSQRLRIGLTKKRERAVDVLRSITEVVCPDGGGAFYLFPDVSALLGNDVAGRPLRTASDLALFLLEEHGVALVPGEAFGVKNSLRLSFAVSSERLSDGLRRLQGGLRRVAEQTRKE